MLHEFAALFSKDTGDDLDPMVEYLAGAKTEVGFDRTESFVMSAENEAGDAGVYKGTGTHRARLDGGIHRCSNQAIISDLTGSLTKCEDLGVCGRVAVCDG